MDVLTSRSAVYRFRIAFTCVTFCSVVFLIGQITAQDKANKKQANKKGSQELSRIGAIRTMATEQGKRKPVTIRGTVTYSNPSWRMMFLQDESGGIYIYGRELPQLVAGEQVLVTGRVRVSSDFKSSYVRMDRLERLGKAKLPPVIREEAADFSPLDDSGVMVEVRGVARNFGQSSGHYYLKLINARREIRIVVSKLGKAKVTPQLLGAEILVRGVWCAEQGSRGLRYVLYLSRQEAFQILKPEPAPPHVRSISHLDVLGNNASVNARVKLHGTVTGVVGRRIFLADETGATAVKLLRKEKVEVGQVVDVIGYVHRRRQAPYLIHAKLRKSGVVSPIMPKLIAIADSGGQLNQLVEIQGIVEKVLPSSQDLVIVLRDGEAKLSAESVAEKGNVTIRKGDSVSVSGVIGQDENGAHRLFFASPPVILEPRQKNATEGPASGYFWTWMVLGVLSCSCLVMMLFWNRGRGLKEQRDTQNHLLTRVEELSHASRVNMLGDIVGALSHELNQPLTSVANYAAATSATVKNLSALPNEEVTSLLEGIEEEAYRAGEIIRRLRALSKKTIKGRSLVDINELTNETVVFYKAQFVCPQNLITLNLSPSLPNVMVDTIQIQQVILNLLTNAREATESIAGRTAKILISTELDADGWIQVTVEDNGSGPSCNDLELIFRSFYTTKEQGMGVGLAICRLIAEVHNGSLQAESVVPSGCRLRLSLPVEGLMGEVA